MTTSFSYADFLRSLGEPDPNTRQVQHGFAYDRDRYRKSCQIGRIRPGQFDVAVPYGEHLAEDVFRAVFQPSPRENPPDPALAISAQLLAQIAQAPEYAKLRMRTVNNPTASLFAVRTIVRELIPNLLQQAMAQAGAHSARRLLDQAAQQRDQAEQRRRLAAKLRERAKALRNARQRERAEQVAQASEQLADQCEQQAAAAEQQAQAQTQQAAGQLEQAGRREAATGSTMLHRGIAHATEAAQSGERLMALFATSDAPDEETHQGDPERAEALLAAAMAIPGIERILAALGRVERIAERIHERSIQSEAGIVHNYTQSRDIPRMTGAARAKLAGRRTRLLWRRDYAEGQLPTHELRGEERAGKGPGVIVVDRSGSMDAQRRLPDGTTCSRRDFAAALTLFAVETFVRSGRRCCVVEFASGARALAIPEGPLAPETVLTILQGGERLGGGTSFDRWIDEAGRVIAQDAFKQADVMLITDVRNRREFALTPQKREHWQRLRQEKEVRCYGLVVANRNMPSLHGHYAAEEDVLADVCTSFLWVEDADDEAAAVEKLFGNLWEVVA